MTKITGRAKICFTHNSEFFAGSLSEGFCPSHFPWISFSLESLVTFCTAETKHLSKFSKLQYSQTMYKIQENMSLWLYTSVLCIWHQLRSPSRVAVAMLDDIDKRFCLFAMQISSNMAKISLNPMEVVAHRL